MTDLEQKLMDALAVNPIVPVITIKSLDDVSAFGAKFTHENYSAIEVTLRTPAALEAIAAFKTSFPDMVLGAGTILSQEDADAAIAAGADFIVTPATSLSLAQALISCPIPVLPGVSTAGEAQTLYELGYKWLKFFPAEANGGVKALKSFSAPLPHLKFMPTGGITQSTAPDYLALPNVIGVGGSWMTK